MLTLHPSANGSTTLIIADVEIRPAGKLLGKSGIDRVVSFSGLMLLV